MTFLQKPTAFALLVLATVWVWMIAPFWLQEGMFLDGLIYASVAQNLADGLGSFWAPVYQPSASVPYSEQLPLFTGLESLFFRALGGSVWTERLFLGCAWMVHVLGIRALQRRWWPELREEASWWAVSVWSLIPLVAWGMGNHVQEMWMSAFALWAVVALSLERWSWLGGVLTVAAYLFKGPQGLFPLVWLPLASIFGIIQKQTFRKSFAWAFAFILLSFAVLWLWDDARLALVRNAENRLVRTFTAVRAVNTTSRFWLLGPMLAQWGIILAATVVFARIRYGAVRFVGDRRTAAFLLFSLCASLPLLITREQRDFYLIPSTVFAALGLIHSFKGALVVPTKRLVAGIGLFLVLGTITISYRRHVRDADLREELAQNASAFTPGSSFNVQPELRLHFLLQAYGMRFNRWQVDLTNEKVHENRIEQHSTKEVLIFRSKATERK